MPQRHESWVEQTKRAIDRQRRWAELDARTRAQSAEAVKTSMALLADTAPLLKDCAEDHSV